VGPGAPKPAPPLQHDADDAVDDGACLVELPNDADPPDESPAAWNDATLVARLRARDERAAAELFARFAPLLADEARRRRVDAGSRHEVVMDTITQAALVLMRSGTPVPGSLAGYLVTSLRRRVLNIARDAQSRLRRMETLATSVAVGTVAHPSVDDADPVAALPPAIADLARALDQHLRDDERQLLAWLGDRVPQREIAEWVGSSYGAVRVRVLRLRERLREVARRYAATLPPDERVLLERYLSAVPPRTPSRPPVRPSPSTGAVRAPGGNRHGTSP
jgi:RNA polymerase sigma factor (sigma-70 family)